MIVYGSHGKTPKEFVDGENNIVKMVFTIHNFAKLQEKRGESICTTNVKAFGDLWKLRVFPRGDSESNADTEYVSISLVYDGKNTAIDPVVAKAVFRTNTDYDEMPSSEFSKEIRAYCCWRNWATRKDMIENDCDDAGTSTITVELQVATEKRSVWFPQLNCCDNNDIGIQLYNSNETSDIIFIIGASKIMEFFGHKCVLVVRARVWYELVMTELESSTENNNSIIILANIDEKVFEGMLRFVYTGEQPKLNDLDEEAIKSLLLAANRFGVTELKLYAESILIEKFLAPSNAVAFLLFADSYICGLLKEKAMDMYASNSKEVMESNEDWTKLKESNDLLVELLIYATSDRKEYSSVVVVDGNNGTPEEADGLDVTALRERLQQVDLDVDGSREILVDRWKNYLLREEAAEGDDDDETEA